MPLMCSRRVASCSREAKDPVQLEWTELGKKQKEIESHTVVGVEAVQGFLVFDYF